MNLTKRRLKTVEPVGFDYQVKPYVDADPIKSLDYTDEEWDADILKNKHLILTCFPDIGLTVEDIYYTKRKYQKKDGVKCSVHYTVDKVRISYSNCMRTFAKIIRLFLHLDRIFLHIHQALLIRSSFFLESLNPNL